MQTASTRAALGLLVLTAGCGGDKGVNRVPDCGGVHLVAFASDRGHPGQFDIYLYDLDALGFRLLASLNSPTASDSSPALTYDGRIIAFVSSRNGPDNPDILIYDRCADGFSPRALLATAFPETDPAFSYDATLLAFARDTLGHRRIRVIDGRSNLYVPLPGLDSLRASWDDWAPSPDLRARLIAFVSNRAGGPHVYVYDALGDSVMDLPDLRTGNADVDPSLTPDGHYLCFASDRPDPSGAGFNVLMYDLVGKTFVALQDVNSDGDELGPSVSADADVIVFQSDRPTGKGKMDVWNHRRSTGQTVQRPGQSSADDDVGPVVQWP